MKWTIDASEELPLAIIEDTEEGIGVLELEKDWHITDRKIAEAIVEAHNKSIIA